MNPKRYVQGTPGLSLCSCRYDPAQWKHQEASGSPPSMDKQQLRHLHQRLAGMLATEMACSA